MCFESMRTATHGDSATVLGGLDGDGDVPSRVRVILDVACAVDVKHEQRLQAAMQQLGVQVWTNDKRSQPGTGTTPYYLEAFGRAGQWCGVNVKRAIPTGHRSKDVRGAIQRRQLRVALQVGDEFVLAAEELLVAKPFTQRRVHVGCTWLRGMMRPS